VQDLLVGHLRAAPSLLLGRRTEARRLVLELRQPGTANPFAIGARVEVDGAVQELHASGPGTFSGSGPALYVGLGDADAVGELRVTWPDRTVETFENVCAQRRVRIER
jgi:hypothetical protein